jgi:hypothetical protein
MQMLPAGDLMAAAGPDVDAFSYHHYGATSQRCAAMGTVVLDSGVPTREGQHVYAHCLRDTPGGVALLVLNTDAREATTLNLGDVAKNGQRYTLTSPELESRTVLLNGHPLALTAKDQLPALGGEALTSDKATFAPISITFVSLPSANNVACARR